MYVCSNGVKTAVILRDDSPWNPRVEQDNLAKMVCWHSRYNLGDKHDYKEPLDFAVAMVEKYLKPKDVFQAMANGELADFQLIYDEYNGEYLVESQVGFGARKHWERLDWKVSLDFEVVEAEDSSFDLETDVLDNCWPDEMLRMCEKYGDVAIQPLYLYDHSGISMSTSSFVGRAQHAEWDSGQVGYIYIDKKTAMENLRMPTDDIRLAMDLTGYKAKQASVPFNLRNVEDVQVKLNATMEYGRFSKVLPEQLTLNDALGTVVGQQCVDWAAEGKLYKKDNKLYVLDGINLDRANVLQSFDLLPVFSYNTGSQPLTEENWRARAEQVLEADVVEYDNYLTDEVYGYKCYEGMEEVDSCWGFYPGMEDIEDLMNDELRGWFGADLDFEYESDEEFDIEEYFENNEFPELRDKIEQDVKDFIIFEDETSEIYPFGVSAEDLLSNAGGVLESVVDEIYEAHAEYDTESIFAAIESHAGLSREAQPKLRAEDFEPGKEYTAEEIMGLMKEKGRPQGVVQDILDNAAARAGGAASKGREVENELT